MKELKNAFIACICTVVLVTTGIAIAQAWEAARLLIYILLSCGALYVLSRGVLDLHQRFTMYKPIPIDQFGTVLHRGNRIVEVAPYHPGQGQPRLQQPVVDTGIEEVNETPALPSPVPTFAELLEQGIIQAALARGEIILGCYADSHELRYGSWLNLYSCLIGGVSGSGKSTTVRFLLFQAALAGARFIFIDPHIGDEDESVAAQFRVFPGIHQFPPIGDENIAAVSKRLTWLLKELDRRKRPGAPKNPQPLILVIDELNALFMREEIKEELGALLLRIGREGRKFNLFFMGIGQRFSQNDLGGKNGAAIREAMASDLAHRFTSEEQAKKFIGSKYGPKCLELATGHLLFRDTNGAMSPMITPLTRATDGMLVARLMTDVDASIPTSIPNFSTSLAASTEPLLLESGPDTDMPPDAPTAPLDALTPQASQVLSLLKARCGQSEIIEQVWGFKSSDGRPYRNAVEEYRAILATLASRMGA